MMSGKRYPEDFRIDAVKPITGRGYKISDVASRLGVTTKSLRDWINKYGDADSQHQVICGQEDELRRITMRYRGTRYLKGDRRVLCPQVPQRYPYIKF